MNKSSFHFLPRKTKFGSFGAEEILIVVNLSIGRYSVSSGVGMLMLAVSITFGIRVSGTSVSWDDFCSWSKELLRSSTTKLLWERSPNDRRINYRLIPVDSWSVSSMSSDIPSAVVFVIRDLSLRL